MVSDGKDKIFSVFVAATIVYFILGVMCILIDLFSALVSFILDVLNQMIFSFISQFSIMMGLGVLFLIIAIISFFIALVIWIIKSN